MTIEFIPFVDVKTVQKPWGFEKWIQPGDATYPFVLKQLLLKEGNRTSLQVHQFKSESIIILSGTGLLLTYDKFFDCARFLNGDYTPDEIDDIKHNLKTIELGPNAVFHTPPGTVHRMVADTDLLYIEASTQELDDVIRLQDDQKREHGRIDNEHR
jgi:mannose-1-phosphate guanylyltransferase